MDPHEFRKLGHELVDWVADYREQIGDFPVLSRVQPGEVAAQLPTEPPLRGTGLGDIVADLERIVMPGITHWNHPGFLAYFPSNTDLASVLADLVSSGLGPQGMSWQTSPACTEVEDVVMDWLRQMVGLPEDFTGVIATRPARRPSAPCSARASGPRRSRRTTAVCRPRSRRSSCTRAIRRTARCPRRRSSRDSAPSSCASSAPTTGTRSGWTCWSAPSLMTWPPAAGPAPWWPRSARPPPRRSTRWRESSASAERHGLWLHVDAALAGSAMICPEYRWMWEGVDGADSIVFNPHKWLGTGFDLAAYFVRDPEHLVRVMSTDPSYLRTAQDGRVRNLRDWGIPLGRRFRALKLWFLLRDSGVQGLQARIRRDIANASWLAAEVDATPEWELLAPAPLQTVCLRHVPAALAGDEDAVAVHNVAIAAAVNDAGRFYLTPSVVKGVQLLRVSIGAEPTEREHVEGVWAALREAAAAV